MKNLLLLILCLATGIHATAQSINGHTYVDLGLPSGTLWATANVGASRNSDLGTQCKWTESATPAKSWGTSWVLPSRQQLVELGRYTTCTWTTVNGVYGQQLTSKVNGKTIFFPAIAHKEKNVFSGTETINYYAFYWGSSTYGEKDYILHVKKNSAVQSDTYKTNSGLLRLVAFSQRPSSCQAPITGHHESYDYVDLGLSVKWATCNIGCAATEDFGSWFMWGDKENTTSCPQEKVRTRKDISTLRSEGIIGTSGNLAPEADIAHLYWGGNWRMPTSAELQELLNNTTATWTCINGKYGYRLVSKKNGNAIFLPAAGCKQNGNLKDRDTNGNYWSSTPEQNMSNSYKVHFSKTQIYHCASSRDFGHSVRPVLK